MSEGKRHPPKVRGDVAGRAKLSRVELETKLGKNAFAVWIAFLWRRDARGWSFAADEIIAAKTQLSERAVESAVTKLRRAGLLESLGYQQNGRRKLRTRLVRGDYRDGCLLLPGATKKMIEALGRGGVRKGAGRKQSTRELQPDRAVAPMKRIKGATAPIKGATASFKGATASPSQPPKTIVMTRGSEPKKSLIRSIKRTKSFTSPSEEGRVKDAARNAPQFRFSEEDEEPRYLEAGLKALARRGIDPGCTDIAVIFTFRDPGWLFVPRYPDVVELTVPKLPSPPLLPDELNDEAAAQRLVRYYRGCVEQRTGQPCFILCRGALNKSRYYSTLVEAADSMRDQEIAPASWIGFSYDVWESRTDRRAARTRKPPPINYVFSLRRFEERIGWFRREEGGYGGGRRLFSNEWREASRRFRELQDSIFRATCYAHAAARRGESAPLTALRVASFSARRLEECFPGGSEDWYEQARVAGARDKVRTRELIQEGAFLWD